MTQQTTSDATEIRAEVLVKAPIDRAFAVFTERGDHWWPRPYRLGKTDRLDLRVEPQVGGRWYERTADGEECDWGRVLVWDPPGHVALSWQIAPGFSPEPDERRSSRIDVRFAPEGPARTVVTLVHSEFERHGVEWKSMRDGVSGDTGWPGLLQAYAALANAATETDARSRTTSP
jgi:uncharacterized protein YndB with AHSA1/START domain